MTYATSRSLLYVLAVFACQACGDRRFPALGKPDGLQFGRTNFDPERFLCNLSSRGDTPESRAKHLGRRFTPDERWRARSKIAIAMAKLDLQVVEQRYAWSNSQEKRAMIYTDCEPRCEGGGVNLYAELRATEPSDEWIVVGAHYDSVETTPGADDNGSGVTAVILAAETLTGLAPRRANLIFAFFDQEESGLIGSEAFAEWLKDGGRKVVAVHVIDMIGNDDRKHSLIELAHGRDRRRVEADLDFMKLYVEAQFLLKRAGVELPRTLVKSNMGRSDHESFLKYGLATVALFPEFDDVDGSARYHQPADTCDRIDFGYLRGAANLAAAAVAIQIR